MVFTGLIEEVAEVLNRTDHELLIARPATFNDIRMGSSIAVSGACLTVASLTDQSMGFDVHEETWARTKLGTLNKGDWVNLERAMKISDRLEGHIVQGHVDGVARVSPQGVRAGGPSGDTPAPPTLTIEYPTELRGLIVEKGSIAVDGVSLTIAHVDDEAFTVALIPETLQKTTLRNLQIGEGVNLEADILGKYVRNGTIRGQ